MGHASPKLTSSYVPREKIVCVCVRVAMWYQQQLQDVAKNWSKKVQKSQESLDCLDFMLSL